MKPAPFDYVVPNTVPEATEALADGAHAEVLAGGQSLVLEMHYRRARPELVVDINRIPELDEVRVSGPALRVGALVRHRRFESPDLVPGPLGRLLPRVARHIAHPPIRALGTMVGSLAWAHPAAEWCTLAVTVDADLELRSRAGVRVLSVHDYFLGPHRTAREPHELIAAVRLPLLAERTGIGFAEHRRTQASFAQQAVVTALTVRDGMIVEARVGLANASDVPMRAEAAERALIGAEPVAEVFDRSAALAAERDADPRAQPYSDVDYARQVIRVLVGRALRDAHRDLPRDLDGAGR